MKAMDGFSKDEFPIIIRIMRRRYRGKERPFPKTYLFRCSDGKSSANSRPPSQQRKDYVSTSYDCDDYMTVADILANESEAGVRFRGQHLRPDKSAADLRKGQALINRFSTY
jgi:hypothetical protein